MNDRPNPDSPSGSRWEPGAGERPDPTREQPTSGDAEEAPRKVTAGRSRRLTLPVAGAAAAGLVTISGLGGFAIGHAVGDDGNRSVSDSSNADGEWQPGDRPGHHGPWAEGTRPDGRPYDRNDDGDTDTESDTDSDTDADTTAATTGATAGGRQA